MPRSQMHGSVLKLLGSRSFDIVAKYQTHRLKIPSFDNMNQASREILLVLIRKVHISITRVASEPFDLSSKSQLHVRDCNCRVCYEIMIFNLTPTRTIGNRNVATVITHRFSRLYNTLVKTRFVIILIVGKLKCYFRLLIPLW
jgi:hypothetical protein